MAAKNPARISWHSQRNIFKFQPDFSGFRVGMFEYSAQNLFSIDAEFNLKGTENKFHPELLKLKLFEHSAHGKSFIH